MAAASKAAEPATVLRVRLPLLPLHRQQRLALRGRDGKATSPRSWLRGLVRARGGTRVPRLTLVLLVLGRLLRRSLLLSPRRTHRLRGFILRNRPLFVARQRRRGRRRPG